MTTARAATLTAADKAFFRAHGYLVKTGLLTPAQIGRAQDALWTGIHADRADPSTWFEAGPPMPVRGDHPDIAAVLHDSPIFAMAEELVGQGRLDPAVTPGPHLVYPRADRQWRAPRTAHLDGYPAPGNRVAAGSVKVWPICASIYVGDVDADGGAFTVWPGSHVAAADYFRTHPRDTLRGGIVEGQFPIGEPVGIPGPAGTACFWHGQLAHAGSRNATDRIRMALVARLSWRSNCLPAPIDDGDLWAGWEGLPS